MGMMRLRMHGLSMPKERRGISLMEMMPLRMHGLLMPKIDNAPTLHDAIFVLLDLSC